MKVAIIVTGFVGLVMGAYFGNFDNIGTCVDKDKSKIENLYTGILPTYEPDEMAKHGFDYVAIGRCSKQLRLDHSWQASQTTRTWNRCRSTEVDFISEIALGACA